MKTKMILIITLTAFLTSSCSHTYYAPAVQHVPLFHEKNDKDIALFVGGADLIPFVGVQGAYALTDYLGIMGGYTNISVESYIEEGGQKQFQGSGVGHHFDLALGYYRPLLDNNFVFEVYAGVEHLSQQHRYSNNVSFGGTDYVYAGKSKISSYKYYVQPAMGFTHKYFDVAISSRLGWLNFYNVDVIDGNRMSDDDFLKLNFLANDYNNAFMLEPAITIRGGWKYVKIQAQYSYSFNLLNTNEKYLFGRNNFNIGLFFTLHQRYK